MSSISAPLGTLPTTFVEGFHDPEVVKKMPYRKFGRSGRLVSQLSLGASSFGNCYGTVTTEQQCHDVLLAAIKAGVNLVDTAPWYGHGVSESVLGRGLKGIPRQAYYLSTKVGRYGPHPLEMFDFTYERTIASVKQSLARLQLDYIDVIQVHDPEFAPSLDLVLAETLPALRQCQKEGLVKYIGITGYPISAIEYLGEHCPPGLEIESCLSYCRYNLHDTSLVSSGCLAKLAALGIGCVNGSPYSMGLLIQRGPPAWHPSKSKLKERCAAAAKKAAELGFDLAHLAFAYCLAEPSIPTTMTSTTSVARLQGDIDMTTGAHGIGEAGYAAIKAIQAEFFSGPEFEAEQLNHWEGEEVRAYWVKVGKALSESWYREQLASHGRPMVWAKADSAEGPQSITAAHARMAPELYGPK